MSITFRPAVKEGIPLLIGLAAGTGGGKSYSALRLATGMAGGKRFAVCDTESGRIRHYADDFAFDVTDLAAPFSPARYSEAIEAADKAGYPVIVVDSMSHEWAGDGGVLDHQIETHKKLGGGSNTKLLSWAEPKQAHRKFVTRLLQVRAHVILCFRAAERVEMAKDPRTGKTEVVAKRSLTARDGWIPITDRELPFELTISALLMADNPGVPLPVKLPEKLRPFVPLDQPLSEETGIQLAAWAAGTSSEPSAEEAGLTDELLDLAERLGKRPATERAVAKHRREQPARHVEWLGQKVAHARERVEEAPAQGALA
jgi:hypothetical protein